MRNVTKKLGRPAGTTKGQMDRVMIQLPSDLLDMITSDAGENERTIPAHIRYIIREYYSSIKLRD